ncbi:MAG: hypothetical protein GX624_07810 [Actinobacteria bacterium]|nr:hypothetical protein [Actinomycetota bacterium]
MRRATTALLAAATILGLALACLAVAACGDEGVPDDAIATVDGAAVSRQDFQMLLSQAQKQMKAQGMDPPEKGSAAYDRVVSQIVDFLVEEQIVARSAPELGISVSDKEVDDEVAALEEAYGGEDQVLAILEEQGMTMALLKRSIRSQTLAQRAAEIVTGKAKVTDADVTGYWKAHKAELVKDAKTRTLADAKGTIRRTLLSAERMRLWDAWMARRAKGLGVEYAPGFDPAELLPSASASPAG